MFTQSFWIGDVFQGTDEVRCFLVIILIFLYFTNNNLYRVKYTSLYNFWVFTFFKVNQITVWGIPKDNNGGRVLKWHVIHRGMGSAPPAVRKALACHLQSLHLSRGDTWEVSAVGGWGPGSKWNTNKGSSGRHSLALQQCVWRLRFMFISSIQMAFYVLNNFAPDEAMNLPIDKHRGKCLSAENSYNQSHHAPSSVHLTGVGSLCMLMPVAICWQTHLVFPSGI